MIPATQSAPAKINDSRFTLAISAGVFLCSLAFYIATLAPTVIWGDSAAFANDAVHVQLWVSADSHPLFLLLSHLCLRLPFEPAYSLNLLCAVIASFAVGVVFSVIHRLTASVPAAIVGAVSLLLSHAFWLHAVITEVYDFNVLFLVLTLWLMLKWQENTGRSGWLYLAVFVFALGLTNHLVLAIESIGLIYFALAVDWKRVLNIKTLLLSAASFACGFSLILYIAAMRFLSGTAASKMVDVATGREFKKAMGTLSWGLLRDSLFYLAYLFYQFPFWGFVLGIAGFILLFKRNARIAWAILLLIGLNAVFFLSFGAGVQSTTKYTFYISDYALFSILIGCGFCLLLERFKRRGYTRTAVAILGLLLAVLFPLLTYQWTPKLSKSLNIDLLHAREIAFRDNEEFFLNPNKRNYNGAEIYAKTALSSATLNSVIIADYTPLQVLRYFQNTNKFRADVLLVSSGAGGKAVPLEVRSNYGKRDIYLAGLMPGYYRIPPLKNEFDFIASGVLYRVSSKDPNDPGQPRAAAGSSGAGNK
jgi:hypothetical protein